MKAQHTQAEVMEVLKQIEVAAVATAAGDRTRTRMTHFAPDEDFTIYLASMKGDPKTLQITQRPSVSLLVHQPGESVVESKEVEIIGSAFIVKDKEEREKALAMDAKRSPVVKYLMETGNQDVLDVIKVVPETIKFRIFKEIVQGTPPTVLEFPKNRKVVSDWSLVKAKASNWLVELRWGFLTATVVPIFLGAAVAWFKTGALHWGYFILTFLAALLFHAGTNVMNDYHDHKSGNDEVNREFVRPFSGGSRVIQMGLLTPLEVMFGALLFFIVGSVIGIYLAWARGWELLVLGAIGLISGMFYTGWIFNWGSRGVGELMVGLNFGPLMALGAYFVQTGSLSWTPVIAAIPVGLLIAAVLYINEFPDFAADKAVGKNTLVVRLGREKAWFLYAFIMAGPYLAVVFSIIAGVLPVITLLALLTLPISVRAVLHARKHHSSSFDLVPANALTVTTHLATGLLLTLAIAWGRVGLEGAGYMVLLTLLFLGFVIYMHRAVEKQKKAFLGLKQAVR